jgi:RNA polymerase sigma factor (sigma-70 family)
MKSTPPTQPSAEDPHALLRRYHDDHHAMVEQTLAARGVPAADRPDVVQDVYLAAFRGLQKGEPIENPPAWMRRIALRRAHNYRRRRNMIHRASLDLMEEPLPASDNPEKNTGDRELLASLLDELDLDVQSIVIARWIEGLSREEVAGQHKVTIHQVDYFNDKALAMMEAALARREKAERTRGGVFVPITLVQLRDACQSGAESSAEERRRSWESIQRKIDILDDAEDDDANGQETPEKLRAPRHSPRSPIPRLLTFLVGGLAGFLLSHLLSTARSSSPDVPPPRLAAMGPVVVVSSPDPVALALSSATPERVIEAREPPNPPKSAPLGAPPDYVLLDQARAAIAAGESTRALLVLQSCKGGQLSTVWQGLWAKACASPEARGVSECAATR